MRSRLRIIVTGLIAQYPLGGVAWDYIQYVVGLKNLGHDVYYLEDTGQSPYVPELGGLSDDPTYTVDSLRDVMSRFGLDDQWAYHFPYPEPEWFGLSDGKREEIVRSADLLINVSGTLARPQEYRSVARLAYLDSDPGFTQVKLARGQEDFRRMVDVHDVLFSFGESLPGSAPDSGHRWLPTRQPVVLSEWVNDKSPRSEFTTVMNWTSYKPIEYQGVTYGQKDDQFKHFMNLPSLVDPVEIEIAINLGKSKRTPHDLLRYRGWRLVDPAVVCPDVDTYRDYLQSSKAEWSVAKGGYVVSECGWFSCRSACYLAAGRPVVAQRTGFENVLPTGVGLFAFSTPDDAVAAIQEIESNYALNCEAALALAREFFDSGAVLNSLLDRSFA